MHLWKQTVVCGKGQHMCCNTAACLAAHVPLIFLTRHQMKEAQQWLLSLPAALVMTAVWYNAGCRVELDQHTSNCPESPAPSPPTTISSFSSLLGTNMSARPAIKNASFVPCSDRDSAKLCGDCCPGMMAAWPLTNTITFPDSKFCVCVWWDILLLAAIRQNPTEGFSGMRTAGILCIQARDESFVFNSLWPTSWCFLLVHWFECSHIE